MADEKLHAHEIWSPFADEPEIQRRVAAVLADRAAGLPMEVRERIEAAAPKPVTMAEPLDGGWVRFYIDVNDGGEPVELGELSRAAFTQEPPSFS
jgi:hypothetical protein